MAFYNMTGSPLTAMGEYLKKASMVIMCVSPSYEESEYCMAEASMAMEFKKKRLVLIMEDHYDPKNNITLHPIVALPMRIPCYNDQLLEGSMEQIFREIESGLAQRFDPVYSFR